MWPILGVVVAVAASAVTWVFNELTREEEARTHELMHERDEIRRDYEAHRDQKDAAFVLRRRKDATRWKQSLLKVLDENRAKISPIRDGLNSLYTVVVQEISADSTSPYRRLALQEAYCRVEDAKFRLDAYALYLDHEAKAIERASGIGEEALLELGPSNALLPDEWLYVGKLVLVSAEEIGTPLPGFGHKLSYGKSDWVRQQALALPFEDEIPILVTKQNGKYEGLFYGCVARGILFYKHIIEQEPVEMVVSRIGPNRSDVIGTAFDEFIQFSLPVTKLLHKHVLPIRGQTILVYPDAYNLTLSRNPISRHPSIGVSEVPPPRLGSANQHPLYIHISETLLGDVIDEDFYGTTTNWSLLDADLDNGKVVLGKSRVRVVVDVGGTGKGLRAESVEQTTQLQVGTAIPFSLTLVSDQIDIRTLHWEPAVDAFRQFALQIALNDGRADIRIAQARFMRQWREVLEYQRTAESVRSAEFDATPVESSERMSTIIVPADQMRDEDADTESLLSLYRQVERDSFLRPERCFRIEHWDAERSIYIPAVPERFRRSIEYHETEAGAVEIHAQLPAEWRNETGRYRFTVQLPNEALTRQRRALDELFHDRLVEPALKDILLSPQSYVCVQDPYWVSREIQWKGRLSPSQKTAVRTALEARHLALIQGPPGTGKTTAIVEMLYQLFTANPKTRVLLVSQQNAAVDNALERLMKTYPELVASAVQVIRVGKKEKVSEGLAEYQFDARYEAFLNRLVSDANRAVNEAVNGAVKDACGETADMARAWATLVEWIAETPERELDRPTLEEFSMLLLGDKNLVGATCVGLSTPKGGVDNLEFDVAIIDEAGRATVPELLIPLLRCKKAILIGDHYQLPPSVSPLLREDSAREILPFLREAFLETSFFELLFERLPEGCQAILSEQYRMAPEIGDLVADLFYTGKRGRTLINGARDDGDLEPALMAHNLCWVNVAGQQKRPRKSTSLFNEDEASSIVGFLSTLAAKAKQATDIAVITPYGAQKKVIIEKLSEIATTVEGVGMKLDNLSIRVDTVDGFQGSEADVVCYSTVRTTGSLQFLLDRKRLNVACSRARRHLVFFGKAGFLSQAKPVGSDVNFFAEILKRAKIVQWRANAGPRRDAL